MPDDVVYRETINLPIDRMIFGINETAPVGGDLSSLRAWTDLDMDSVPVRVSPGAIRFVSLVGTHVALVTIEVWETAPESPASEFELVGRERYRSTSGDASLFTINGPYATFPLRRDTEYMLSVWRKGGDDAQERYDELAGRVYPKEGLEEYVIQFSE
ncbi:hypothetical protein OG723_19160 [Streptomyces sp. NBC_01278]|uniref:hypothetical protein n=1 Tax=unclassified Streptomyces TaxID=2593676 RepID=UPI002E34C482|nr:hypothetical protein [Streptomyces sp. NBC_01278]